MKLNELFQNGIKILLENSFNKQTATKDAKNLLTYVMHFDDAMFLRYKNSNVNIAEQNNYSNILKEYTSGKPLEYITHNANFFGYNFFVNESTLIPRIDSEVVIEFAIKYVKNNKDFFKERQKNNIKIKILDACCGSGCLGLSFVKTILDKNVVNNNIELTFIDISSMAMQVAKINSQKLNLDKQISIKYLISDILINNLGNEIYDIILCNPPYIESDTIDKLDKSVKEFEPRSALDGGIDGLKFYKSISAILRKNMSSASIAFFEIGYNQAIKTTEIFTSNNFTVDVKKDYGNNDRCLIIKTI